MIELAAVTKRYANQEVLAEIDLRIEPGTTTVIIGPSGCGKSTVLRLMVGLIAPDLGEVTFEGRSLSRATVMAVRHRTGYVIQDGGLFPHLTARENITLLAGVLGWPNTRIQRRLSRLADLTKFPVDGLDRLPVELSGGQRQRVALMRALMLDPDVLLLDEPLAALDPMIRFDLQTDLREIFRELAKTVVLVTHDLAEAAFLGDRIVLMRAGKIVQEGSLDQMLTRPADEFVSRFVNAQRRSL
jgi:osmoprotectant transport system ATP-binding protein